MPVFPPQITLAPGESQNLAAATNNISVQIPAGATVSVDATLDSGDTPVWVPVQDNVAGPAIVQVPGPVFAFRLTNNGTADATLLVLQRFR